MKNIQIGLVALGFLSSSVAMAIDVQQWAGKGTVDAPYGQENDCETTFSFSKTANELEVVNYAMQCEFTTLEFHPFQFEIVGKDLRLGEETVGSVDKDGFNFQISDGGSIAYAMSVKISPAGVLEHQVKVIDPLGSGSVIRATASLSRQ